MINRKKKAKIREKFCFNFQGLIFIKKNTTYLFSEWAQY